MSEISQFIRPSLRECQRAVQMSSVESEDLKMVFHNAKFAPNSKKKRLHNNTCIVCIVCMHLCMYECMYVCICVWCVCV